jgi:hypothetical protein
VSPKHTNARARAYAVINKQSFQTQTKIYLPTSITFILYTGYIWRWQPFEIQSRVISLNYTDVSHTVAIIRAMNKMMEAVRTSETSVYFNDTTWQYIPEGCHLHTRRRENPNSHAGYIYLFIFVECVKNTSIKYTFCSFCSMPCPRVIHKALRTTLWHVSHFHHLCCILKLSKSKNFTCS